MEEKCRVCLGNKKTLLSIFNSNGNSIEKMSFADMICAIANVKISRGVAIPDKICRGCRKKLEDAYEFKLTIERSDAAFNETLNRKKITFSNIDDIKMEIEIDFDYKPRLPLENDILNGFNEGANEVQYIDTIIKKSMSTDNIYFKPVPVLEFLKTIKDELDDDFYGDFEADVYDNYEAIDTDIKDDNYAKYYHTRSNRLRRDQQKKSADDLEDVDDTPLLERLTDERLLKKRMKDEYYDDDDYVPKYKIKKLKNNNNKNSNKENKIKVKRKRNQVHKVFIKPVYMDNLEVVFNKGRDKINETKATQESGICPHCGLITNKRTLDRHLIQHTGERLFKCDECGKSFFTDKDLAKHKQRSHALTRDFKCDKCIATFVDKHSLNSHKICHSSEMKYKCEQCGKPFKRNGAFRRHVMSHNSANKNVKCDLCNMSFFTKYNLRHHLRIHTGERPFNCELCSQPYSYKHDFNRHCLKKHGVILKQRKVRVMNAEVLEKERQIMRELALRLQGVIDDGKPINPFESEGPTAPLAFKQAVKALENRQIPIDI